MKDNTIVLIVLIISITILEMIALIQRIDGQIFATVISGLVGILGYFIGQKYRKKI